MQQAWHPLKMLKRFSLWNKSGKDVKNNNINAVSIEINCKLYCLKYYYCASLASYVLKKTIWICNGAVW